jgi:cytidine deaminase
MQKKTEPSSIAAAGPQIRELYEAAKKARENSHSPYSGCKVGAALRTTEGKVFAGCNVENASYGATVCAERGAIQTAVATLGQMTIAEILVVTDASPGWPPCGMCRQVITEFSKNVTLHITNLKGDLQSVQMLEIFPNPFTASDLRK